MAQALTLGANDRAREATEGLLARPRKALADYRLYRATLAELSHLSDRDLSDLGINRHSIRAIAHQSVYGG